MRHGLDRVTSVRAVVCGPFCRCELMNAQFAALDVRGPRSAGPPPAVPFIDAGEAVELNEVRVLGADHDRRRSAIHRATTITAVAT